MFKTDRSSFFDVVAQFIYGLSLCEIVLANAARAPGLAVVVDLNLYEHLNPSLHQRFRVLRRFAISAGQAVF
jgi:hypothetical protein